MKIDITIEIMLSVILIVVFYYTHKNKAITSTKLYIHGFLIWILLISFYSSILMLSWALKNFIYIEKYFYVDIGIIPDWFNLCMWGLSLVVGLIAILIVYDLISGKDKGRKKLLRYIPIFYLVTVYEIFKASSVIELTNTQFILMILFSVSIPAIPYFIMYHFYRRKDVKSEIFKKNVNIHES